MPPLGSTPLAGTGAVLSAGAKAYDEYVDLLVPVIDIVCVANQSGHVVALPSVAVRTASQGGASVQNRFSLGRSVLIGSLTHFSEGDVTLWAACWRAMILYRGGQGSLFRFAIRLALLCHLST